MNQIYLHQFYRLRINKWMFWITWFLKNQCSRVIKLTLLFWMRWMNSQKNNPLMCLRNTFLLCFQVKYPMKHFLSFLQYRPIKLIIRKKIDIKKVHPIHATWLSPRWHWCWFFVIAKLEVAFFQTKGCEMRNSPYSNLISRGILGLIFFYVNYFKFC